MPGTGVLVLGLRVARLRVRRLRVTELRAVGRLRIVGPPVVGLRAVGLKVMGLPFVSLWVRGLRFSHVVRLAAAGNPYPDTKKSAVDELVVSPQIYGASRRPS